VTEESYWSIDEILYEGGTNLIPEIVDIFSIYNDQTNRSVSKIYIPNFYLNYYGEFMHTKCQTFVLG
jgi:hypothetical protein